MWAYVGGKRRLSETTPHVGGRGGDPGRMPRTCVCGEGEGRLVTTPRVCRAIPIEIQPVRPALYKVAIPSLGKCNKARRSKFIAFYQRLALLEVAAIFQNVASCDNKNVKVPGKIPIPFVPSCWNGASLLAFKITSWRPELGPLATVILRYYDILNVYAARTCLLQPKPR